MPKATFTIDGKQPYPEINGKFQCLVCRRQFGTADKIDSHISSSELHEQSLTKAKAEGRIKDTADAPARSALGAGSLDDASLNGIFGAASKLEDTLKMMAKQKAALQGRLAKPAAPKPAASAAPAKGGSSSLDALFAFENKMAKGAGGGFKQGEYRDRAAERRESAGRDDDPMPAASTKRAREINNNIDWKCNKCQMVNFARVITCNKCGAEVDDDTEYLVNHLQEKRHKAIMQMVRATNPEMAKIADDNNKAITGSDGRTSGKGDEDRPGLGF